MTDRKAFWAPLDAAELPFVDWIERHRGDDRVRAAVGTFTKLGEHGAVWHAVGAAGQLLDARRRERWRAVNVAVFAAYAVNTAAKVAAQRKRPPHAGVATPTALSFPSAHAATAAAADRALRGLLPRTLVRPLAIALPLSRLYFGVHYLSDIVAGAVLGRLVARATLRRWPRRSTETAPIAKD